MSFDSLNKDELTKVAEFFLKDVEVADEDKGPTKKELLAALAQGDEDSDNDAPVSWDDYKNVYLPAQEEKKPAAGPDLTAADVPADKNEEPEDESNYVLIKMERKNGRYDVLGLTFTKAHPFHSVPPEKAEYIVRNVEGFRLAMPSEVSEYYN